MAAEKKDRPRRYRKIKSAPDNRKTESILNLIKQGGADEKIAPIAAKRLVPPAPVDLLDAVGVKEWQRVAELLVSANMVTDMDTTALLLYCDAYSDFVRAIQELKKSKRQIVKVGKQNGGQYRDPWYDIKKKAAQEMNQYLALLGLSPGDRAKMKTPKRPTAGTGGNPFDEI